MQTRQLTYFSHFTVLCFPINKLLPDPGYDPQSNMFISAFAYHCQELDVGSGTFHILGFGL